MKKLTLICGMLALVTSAAQATVYSYTYSGGFANGGVVPDGNPTGWSDSRSVSLAADFGGGYRLGESTSIRDVDVRISVANGYNGDLYAYLVHSSGFAVLLNRVGRTSTDGFGYSDPGFITFKLDDDAVNGDVHGYTPNNTLSPLSGIWALDGRNVDPATVLDTDARTRLLNQFNGLDADGSWTLFLSDMSGGGVSTVQNWGMDITVVPEPTTWAMIIFGVMAGGWKVSQHLRKRRQVA